MSTPERSANGDNADIRPLADFERRRLSLGDCPEPVHQALDILHEKADELDLQTSRTEIVAALIMDVMRNDADANYMARLILRHRKIRIRYLDPGEED